MGHDVGVKLAARLAFALLALSLVGSALAQCERGPTTSEVTLPGFIAAYYASFRSDTANDLADFYGGVCVTAVGGEWTVLADSVRITGLSGDMALSAPNATFIYGAWRIFARRMEADENHLALSDASVTGPDVAGNSTFVTLDLKTGIIDLSDLELQSAAFVLRGDGAVLRGDNLSVTGAVVTTCIDVARPAYQLEGLSAEVDLANRSVALTGGRVSLGEISIPLRERVVLSEETLASFELPVKVQYLSDEPERRPGSGLGVRMVGIPLSPGVSLDVGATGVDTEHDAAPVALVNVRAQLPATDGGEPATVTAIVGVEAGRPHLDFSVARPLTAGLTLDLSIFSGAAPAADVRHDAALALDFRHAVPLDDSRPASRRAGLSISASAFAAVTALVNGDLGIAPSVVGPRLGGSVGAELSSGTTRLGAFALSVDLGSTAYPQHAAQQWSVRLRPSWRLATGPLSATVSHDALFTNSASPFGVAVDLLTPRQRSEATVRLAGELWRSSEPRRQFTRSLLLSLAPPPSIDAFVQVRAVHELIATPRQVAGLRQLRTTIGATYHAEPWEASATAVFEASALIDPSGGQDAFLRLGLQASRAGWPVFNSGAETPNVPSGTLELGLETVYGLAAADPGLRRLEARAALPLAFRTFEVRPYLAFDFAPTLVAGLAPEWSAHGVDLTFITCCGSLTVGYLNDRGAWSASLAVDLERRPPKE